MSIERHTAGSVSIIQFTPSTGPVSTSVTIHGTGFSITPSQNTVTFNGVTATVTSSTANQIVTTVPSGATSGAIAITTTLGSASSGGSFTVTSTTPTISSFTPQIGTAGTAVTVSGTNLDTVPTNNRLKFNGKSATVSSSSSTSLATSTPSQTGSGRLTLATPAGTATGGDFFIPPSPYVAADVSNTDRATAGQATTVAMNTASKIGLLVIDATQGHRLALNLTSVTIPWTQVSVRKPDGSELVAPTWSNTAGRFVESPTLPSTGTYTIVVDPDSTNTGSMTVTGYDVTDVFSGTITPGGSAASTTIATPGQNGLLTFTGSASQRVSLMVGSVSIPWSLVSIANPNGTTLLAPTWVNTAGRFIDPQTLSANGTYTILVDPENANTGSATFTLYDVPADSSGTITAGGSAVTLTVTTPGQNPYVSFSGSSGQGISLTINSVTIPWSLVSITKPDGSALLSPTWMNTGGYTSSTLTLPTTGTYKIVVDPEYANTGSATLTLANVP